jgi:tetratricopeptide (TPR) repeat protein
MRGELWEKAVTYLRQAGAKALVRSSNREALAYFEQALTALTHLSETRETLEQAIDVRFDLRNALFPLAESGQIEAYLREAEILARSLDDQRRLGWVSFYLTMHHLATGSGHSTDMLTLAQRVRNIADTLCDYRLQAIAQVSLAHVCYISGDYRGTEDACRRPIHSVQGDQIRERRRLAALPAVLARFYLARILGERGAFDEGGAHGEEAIRIAETLDQPFSLICACLGLAYVKSLRGELSQAIRLLERAVAQSREWNVTYLALFGMASLGHTYAWSGRIREGVSWLEQALTAHASARIGWFHVISAVQGGEVYLLAGQVEDARACAERAMMLAHQRGERGHEAWALRLLGEIALRHTRPDVAAAETHYRAAIALASELEMRPLVAHCHLGLGKLYRRPGLRQEAQEHLATATTMYRDMDMRFWLEQAEQEVKRLS